MSNIDPEIQRTLDSRLAKGEIQLAEYQALITAIQGQYGKQSAPPNAIRSTKTPRLIAEVDDLRIFDSFIELGGARKAFSDIKDAGGSSNRLVVGFFPSIHHTWLTIQFRDGSEYRVDEERVVLGRERHKKILECLAALKKITWNERFNALLRDLKVNREVAIGRESNETWTAVGFVKDAIAPPRSRQITLRVDGAISNGVLVLDLKKCRSDGVLELGVQRVNKSAPGQVYACQKKSLLQRSSNEALFFDIQGTHSSDAVISILDWMAKPGKYLSI